MEVVEWELTNAEFEVRDVTVLAIEGSGSTSSPHSTRSMTRTRRNEKCLAQYRWRQALAHEAEVQLNGLFSKSAQEIAGDTES